MKNEYPKINLENIAGDSEEGETQMQLIYSMGIITIVAGLGLGAGIYNLVHNMRAEKDIAEMKAQQTQIMEEYIQSKNETQAPNQEYTSTNTNAPSPLIQRAIAARDYAHQLNRTQKTK